MNLLKLFLLGPFQATLAGKPIEHFDTSKTRALLAYLAAECSLPQQREYLAALLWPGFSSDAALRNLRLTLFRLRQVLEQAAAEAALPEEMNLLSFPDRHIIRLSGPPEVWADIQEFENLLDLCGQHAHSDPLNCVYCIDQLTQAVSLYRGDFLEGFSLKDSSEFEKWAMTRRERLHLGALGALDRLASHFLTQLEDPAAGADRQTALAKARLYAQRMLQLEPGRESAHRQYMKALALGGQIQEALAQYQLCIQMLADEFGTAPDALTTQLYQQIREHSYGNPAESALPISVGDRPPNNLVAPLTPLIGREAQVARLEHLLFSYRWVTLVGEGGIGKTRLALSAAEHVLSNFTDGVWLVPLAEVQPAGDNRVDRSAVYYFLVKSIAAVLALPFQDDDSAMQRLLEFLSTRKLLLILDSFEHLSMGADLIMDLLVQAPKVHIMVTTRQVMHFQAGYVMRVDGLPVPEREDDPYGGEYASVRLFNERVERLSGSFVLNEQNLPVVIRICKLLDGVPLAIELAAPWAAKSSLEAIAYSIQNDLDFLTSSMAGMPERHRSMRSVFESSWRLLSPRVQRILAVCATLPTEFTYEQIRAAAQATPGEIETLVDNFMIFRSSAETYQLHEILRQYGLEKLKEQNRSNPRL